MPNQHTPEIPMARLAGEFVRLTDAQVVNMIESGRYPSIITGAITSPPSTALAPVSAAAR